MRVAAIGVGGAGGRIVDALLQDDDARSTPYLTASCALDTDQTDLTSLTAVPDDARHLFGQVETGGTGTDGDQAQATTALESDVMELRRAADAAITSATDAILLVAGLAGGTGGGATHRLAAALRGVYDLPIYTVSVLPAGHEDVPADNAARALQALDQVVDAQLVFDNDAWLANDDPIDEHAAELNAELAERLGALCSAGEATAADSVAQRVVDASEIFATLNEGGLATMGYARYAIRDDRDAAQPSVLDRVRGLFGAVDSDVDELEAQSAVETTLRRAAQHNLTFDCPLDAATSGLLVVSGPPEWLHGSAIAEGQRWLSSEMGSVQLRTGDNPQPDSEFLSVLVVLAGIQDTPRITELRSIDS